MWRFFWLLLWLSPPVTFAQTTDPEEELNSQQLEDLSEALDEEGMQEDDYNIQQLRYYRRHPLSINAPEEELNDFPLFDAIHVQNILLYRKISGPFISIYELQAVPAFSLEFLRNIEPYITIGQHHFFATVNERFHSGTHSFVLRPVIVMQKASGFSTENPASRFAGDRLGVFARYRYQYRNLLQYGITVDKDPGEKFLQKQPPFLMDFQSAHFFLRDVGAFKAIAIGDFTINLGQGLIHWQSQAFKKTSGVLHVKRQSEVLRPYQSAGESNYFRGTAVAIRSRRLEATVFASSRNLSANVADSDQGPVATSIDFSGYHRTGREESKRNALHQFSWGGNVKWKNNFMQVGGNYMMHRFSLPMQKQEEPYNLYGISGSRWMNGSIDWSPTWRNYHFFGEAAGDVRGKPALVVGFLSSLHRVLDLSVLYGNIHRQYQALYGNAFTENSLPSNENGIYGGISLKLSRMWKLDVYADVFTFAWLKYRVDAPSGGSHHFVQLHWKPSRHTELYTRYRRRFKPLNTNGEHVSYPELQVFTNWRTHIAHQLSRQFTLRCRMERTTFRRVAGAAAEQGYLYFTDLIYKPDRRWYSFNIGLQYFEADSYNTRIYAYEPDLLFVSSSPAFFDRGIRSLVNFKAKLRLKLLGINTLTASVKVANTSYPEKKTIGSAGNAIHGKNRTDVRFQLFITPAS